MKVTFSAPVAVHVPPVTPETTKWGVYAIPHMWRHPDGRLMIRVNGHQDTLDPEYTQKVTDAHYVSTDEGCTWLPIQSTDTPEVYNGPVFCKRQDGTSLQFYMPEQLNAMNDIPVLKQVDYANQAAVLNVYRYADIPEGCKRTRMITYDANGTKVNEKEITIHFPEFEPAIPSAGKSADGEEYNAYPELRYPCYRSITDCIELPDGTLAAMMLGQCPEISDKTYDLVHMVVSEDNGLTWKKRSTIGIYDPDLDFGYTNENCMVIAPNGDLVTVMRTEHCVPRELEHRTGTMCARSSDLGRTWTKPVEIADSSVTPHLVVLENGVMVLVYGRPGVHLLYSTDNGQTWSGPITVIGKTLEEHMQNGDDYMSCKYWDMDTYANTDLCAVSDDTVLLCYNDMKYQTGDGLNHRATMTVRITFEP